MDKETIKNTSRNILITIIYLYLFLMIMPFIILNLTSISIKLPSNLIAGISFVYALICALVAFFNYKKLSILDNKEKIKRSYTLRKGILVIFTYFFTTIFEGVFLYLLEPNYQNLPIFTKTIYLSLYELIQVGIIVYILRDEIRKCIKDIKKNHKNYFSSCGKYYLIALVLMALSNIIISIVNAGNIAGNEQTVRELFSKAPLYMYFSAVIIAPILEELTFRQGVRNIFTNDKVFIIMSGLIFGGLHVIGNVNAPIDLLYLVPYSIPGMAFAYMLTKTKNIFTSMGFHFLHNGITMTLQLILLLLGR